MFAIWKRERTLDQSPGAIAERLDDAIDSGEIVDGLATLPIYEIRARLAELYGDRWDDPYQTLEDEQTRVDVLFGKQCVAATVNGGSTVFLNPFFELMGQHGLTA
jgi:hypothetical protein